MQWANAGSATLSAYVGTHTCCYRRHDVTWSGCPIVCKGKTVGKLCCCGPAGRRCRSIAARRAAAWRANAGSATLSAYVVAGRRLAVLVEYIGHDPHEETLASRLKPSPSTLLAGQDSNRSIGYSSAGSMVGIQVAQSSVSTIH